MAAPQLAASPARRYAGELSELPRANLPVMRPLDCRGDGTFRATKTWNVPSPPSGLFALEAELFCDPDGPVVGALDGVGRSLAAEHLAEHVGPEVGRLQRRDPRHGRGRVVAAAGVAGLVGQVLLPDVGDVRAGIAGLDLRLVPAPLVGRVDVAVGDLEHLLLDLGGVHVADELLGRLAVLRALDHEPALGR